MPSKATKSKTEKAGKEANALVQAAAKLVWVVAYSFDRVGIPMTLLLISLGSIWLLGNEKTQDEFVRELLFAEKTRGLVTAYFVFLVTCCLFGGVFNWRKLHREDGDEMKRIGAEKSRLQERLIGQELHHTGRHTQLPKGGQTPQEE